MGGRGVGVLVGVLVGVGVSVGIRVSVAVGVGLAVGVAVKVGFGVQVGVGVGVGAWPTRLSKEQPRTCSKINKVGRTFFFIAHLPPRTMRYCGDGTMWVLRY